MSPRPVKSNGKKGGGLFSCFSCVKPQEEDVQELDFAHCSLDNVPNDIFAYERTLETLFLECNNIRDLPRQLFQCQELKVLNVSDNDVHQLPPAVSSLVQLVNLNVSKNVLTEIPDTIKQLKHLAVLDASINPLQKIPEGCTQLLSITELYLNDTFLEFLPANFGRLVKLKILELRENGLNALPKSLARLTSLHRLDLGQNDFFEMPEVIGSLTELTELWIDGNRIKQISPIVGNLAKLNHFEASFNHIEKLSDAIVNCKSLEHLSFTTNDLRSLPNGLGELEKLITLKLDDNQLESLPNTIGQLKELEELILSQNYLTNLPPSVGLCRRLHTLNIDDNDIEFLPEELGSCISLKILSAQGNRLTTLPAELDHIVDLAVINLTGNMIQNLPVSLMRLRNITALWLAENQNKPLIQLNQDTDPETGRRVLTNFMLPQQPESGFIKDNVSESGSFHASVWEEQRSKKSHVKWAGDNSGSGEDQEEDLENGALRREPTPFPKEMRAMAKRVQNMRTKTGSNEDVEKTQHHQRRRNSRENQRENPDLPPTNGRVQIKEAKVSKPQASPVLSERHLLAVYKDERTIKEQMELKSFEELERSLDIGGAPKPSENAANVPNRNGMRRSPDKTSRDSGVITPSDGSITSPESEPLPPPPPSIAAQRKPSDPLPKAPETFPPAPPPIAGSNFVQPPVKAEIVTNELDKEAGNKIRPPPYHIAATMSKRAQEFNGSQPQSEEERFYENQPAENGQRGLQPHQSQNSASDTNSVVSEQSEVSTAPSSLQTIVRAPFQNDDVVDESPQRAVAMRKPSGIAISQSRITSLKTNNSASNNSGSESDYADAHALHLRKVSEQLLSNPRTRQSVTGIPMLNSRPGSFASPKGTTPVTDMSSPMSRMTNTSSSSSSRPSSQMSFIPVVNDNQQRPPSVLGRPSPSPLQAPNTRQSMIPQRQGSQPPVSSTPNARNNGNPSNGLLNTIEKAAHSDEEYPSFTQPNYENVSSPPSRLVSPGFATQPRQGSFHKPNMTGDRMSTSQFVMSKGTPSPQGQQQYQGRIPTPTNGYLSPSRSMMDSRIPKPAGYGKK